MTNICMVTDTVNPAWSSPVEDFFLGGGDSLTGNENSGSQSLTLLMSLKDSVTEDEEFPDNGRCHSSSFDCVN